MKELESMLVETNSRLDSLTDAVARVETSTQAIAHQNDASNSAPSGVLPDRWEAAVSTAVNLVSCGPNVAQYGELDYIGVKAVLPADMRKAIRKVSAPLQELVDGKVKDCHSLSRDKLRKKIFGAYGSSIRGRAIAKAKVKDFAKVLFDNVEDQSCTRAAIM
ncbi:hypothetical protein HDU77_000996, partial [Chytriomyces hyalinus]